MASLLPHLAAAGHQGRPWRPPASNNNSSSRNQSARRPQELAMLVRKLISPATIVRLVCSQFIRFQLLHHADFFDAFVSHSPHTQPDHVKDALNGIWQTPVKTESAKRPSTSRITPTKVRFLLSSHGPDRPQRIADVLIGPALRSRPRCILVFCWFFYSSRQKSRKSRQPKINTSQP